MIAVQQDDFDVAGLYAKMVDANNTNGAIVTFVGLVRDFAEDDDVFGLYLEHYPGMTERVLNEISDEAKQRWALGEVIIIHRIGDLAAGDQIVFVGVASPHRKDAFEASQFIMDILKTKAPFWKKEKLRSENRWVSAKPSDEHQGKRWIEKS